MKKAILLFGIFADLCTVIMFIVWIRNLPWVAEVLSFIA